MIQQTLIGNQNQFIFEPSTPQARHKALNPDFPLSPYYGIVGNRKIVDRLIRIDFHALGQPNHDTSKLNVAILGTSGLGKTEIARRHCQANRLPTVELGPKSVQNLQDIFVAVKNACKTHNLNIVPIKENHYTLPPCNIFLDEIHAVSNNIIQGLLKATEPKDRTMHTEEGLTVNCKYVHWIIGTTERGKLPDAFDNRFIRLQLSGYTKDEIAQIVNFNNPDIPMEACQLAAHYAGKIPREAIIFADEMKLEYEMSPKNWNQIADKIAKENDIDEFGMTSQRLKVITLLGQGPMAANRLSSAVGVKLEELERFILPWLFDSLNPLVKVSTKGYSITQNAINELIKRNIPYNPEYALND